MQYTYAGPFYYLNVARDMIISLPDIKARIAVLWTGITHIQVHVEKVHIFLDAVATHIITPILIPPSDLKQLLSDVKEGMITHPKVSLPYCPKEDI